MSFLFLLVLGTASSASVCTSLQRRHEQYKSGYLCGDNENLLEKRAVHAASFYGCAPFRPRRCVSNVSPVAIDWTRLGNRTTGDCITCWRKDVDVGRWLKFIGWAERTIGAVLSPPLIRTVLDVGAGSGNFLWTLRTYRNVSVGVGLTRNWDSLPYLETGAAQGLILLHYDFRNYFPAADQTFDLIHCSWVLNVLSDLSMIEAVLSDWHRLLRPGGYVIQNGFRVAEDKLFDVWVHRIRRWIEQVLQMDVVHWSTSRDEVLKFIVRKTMRVQPPPPPVTTPDNLWIND